MKADERIWCSVYRKENILFILPSRVRRIQLIELVAIGCIGIKDPHCHLSDGSSSFWISDFDCLGVLSVTIPKKRYINKLSQYVGKQLMFTFFGRKREVVITLATT